MFGIGLPELIVILVIALVVLGPKRLPEVARTLGKAMGEFRRQSSEILEEFQHETRLDEEANRRRRPPAPPPPGSVPGAVAARTGPATAAPAAAPAPAPDVEAPGDAPAGTPTATPARPA